MENKIIRVLIVALVFYVFITLVQMKQAHAQAAEPVQTYALELSSLKGVTSMDGVEAPETEFDELNFLLSDSGRALALGTDVSKCEWVTLYEEMNIFCSTQTTTTHVIVYKDGTADVWLISMPLNNSAGISLHTHLLGAWKMTKPTH